MEHSLLAYVCSSLKARNNLWSSLTICCLKKCYRQKEITTPTIFSPSILSFFFKFHVNHDQINIHNVDKPQHFVFIFIIYFLNICQAYLKNLRKTFSGAFLCQTYVHWSTQQGTSTIHSHEWQIAGPYTCVCVPSTIHSHEWQIPGPYTCVYSVSLGVHKPVRSKRHLSPLFNHCWCHQPKSPPFTD